MSGEPAIHPLALDVLHGLRAVAHFDPALQGTGLDVRVGVSHEPAWSAVAKWVRAGCPIWQRTVSGSDPE
jgi:hypothetical protein